MYTTTEPTARIYTYKVAGLGTIMGTVVYSNERQ